MGIISGVMVLLLIMSITLAVVCYKKKSRSRNEFQSSFYVMNKLLHINSENACYLTQCIP